LKRALLLVSVALVMPAAAAAPRPGGSVVIAAAVDCPNYWFACSAWLPTNQVILGAFRIAPDLTYKPSLVSRAVVTTSPFAVTYAIRPEARWSDGVPVGARDFLFTAQVFRSPRNSSAADAPPYAAISSVQMLGPKLVKVVFRTRYAAWRNLFHSVFPQHALAGEDMHAVWTEAIDNPKTGQPISDGPFMVSSFVPGEHLTLVRNPRFWGEHKAYLDSVVFRDVADPVGEIDAVAQGSVDAASPQFQSAQLTELRKRPRVAVRTSMGTTFEHVLFQLGPRGNPLIRRPFVRQAVAFGIDRADLVRRLFGDLVSSPSPLQNLILVPNGRSYVAHWGGYRLDRARARRLLESHGCRRGADGIYGCGGVRLSLRFATTALNPTRQLTFSILHDQLGRVGIELVPVFAAPPIFFREVLPAGDFDLALFTWVNQPDPGYAVEIWRCGGSENYGGYCNRALSRALVASNGVLDEAARAAALNRVDAQLAADLPAIPLYQRPTVVAYKSGLQGVVDNPTDEGWTWNLGDWWLSR
jgi:peptide/nickel transport system substrate-binding protein